MAPMVCPSTLSLNQNTNEDFRLLFGQMSCVLKLFPGSLFAYDKISSKSISNPLKSNKAEFSIKHAVNL